ncbi:hypothetical protein BJX62DRAFT_238167 [Aspergillus germanicus]
MSHPPTPDTMEPRIESEAEVEEKAKFERSPAPEPASSPTLTPAPTPAPAPAATPMLFSRMFIIAVHPSGTNNLSTLFDLPNQPSIMAIDNLFSGPFKICFESSQATNRRFLISNTQTAIQRNLQEADYAWAHAYGQGKILCANVCAPWLLNPSVLNGCPETDQAVAHCGLFKARVPESYDLVQDGLFNYTNMNLSMFPDEYLRTWGMAFVIVHPVGLFPLIYRALKYTLFPDPKHSCALHMTYHWMAVLYRWAETDSAAPTPIVMDADTLIENPVEYAARFCQQTGLRLDPAPVRFYDAWVQRQVRERDNKGFGDRFIRLTAEGRSTLDAVIKLAKPRWAEDFGNEAAEMIEDAVRAAQDDYMYLYDRRLQ